MIRKLYVVWNSKKVTEFSGNESWGFLMDEELYGHPEEAVLVVANSPESALTRAKVHWGSTKISGKTPVRFPNVLVAHPDDK